MAFSWRKVELQGLGDETGTFWGKEERKRKMEKDRMEGRPEELRGSRKCKLEEWGLSLSSTPLLPFSREPTPIKGLLTKFSQKDLLKLPGAFMLLIQHESRNTEMLKVLSLNLFPAYAHSCGGLILPCCFTACWYIRTPKLFSAALNCTLIFCCNRSALGESWTLRWGIRIHWWWW